MTKIIIAIVMFLFLILFHEFGHFIVAKLSGIKVNEFSVGMGPEIFSTVKGETQYSLRLIPIGGYCAMEGEDEESDDKRSFENAPAYKRFLTILAGPVMNLLLAFLIFSVVAFNTGSPTRFVGGFPEKSPARDAGIEVGDEVRVVGDREVVEFADISKNISEFYEENEEDVEIPVRIYRENEGEKDFSLKPFEVNGSKVVGIESKLGDNGFFESIKEGFLESGRNIKMIFTVLGGLFTGKIAFSALSGPIGVVKELGNQASNGLMSLLYFLSYISVNLAVFNLLPIPALDGSKLVTSFYEMVTKKKVNKKVEGIITIVGFVLLIGLIIIISVKDILTLL